MITWMQRHKKWLMVFIWISTIAFIGAGAVSWGSFDLNVDRSTSVAKVADEKISVEELNQKFAQVFDAYNVSGTLTEEQAKERQLDILALNLLIEDKLLITYAKQLGLVASEYEILSLLISDRNFFDESKTFNKDIYYKLLAQNNLKPSEYEKMLADSILLRKLNTILDMNTQEKELQMLASNLFMQDLLDIKMIKADDKELKIDEKELEKFYEEYKQDYKTNKIYRLSSYFLPISTKDLKEDELRKFYEANKQKYTDFTGKILSFDLAKDELSKDFALEALRKTANETYLALAKKELEFQKEINISDDDVFFPVELLRNARVSTPIKPFEMSDENGQKGYMIVRVNSVDPVRIKTFAEAREEILPLFLAHKKQDLLKIKAEQALKNFKGQSIAWVDRESQRDTKKISQSVMNDAEFSLFLANVFNQDQNKSFVILGDKAIIYEIKGQKLLNQEKLNRYKNELEQDIKVYKATELRKELLAELRKLYGDSIKIYYKGKQS